MTDLPEYYRPVNVDGFRKVDPDEGVGPTIQMKWIEIEKLFVDTRYQREVSKGDKSNCRQIAKRFKWRRFAPVIVTPIFGTDFYSIIDGQHKATGALLRGLKTVPCGVVETASLEDQADSFKFLNANTTKIMLFDLFKANLAANDIYAVKINNLAQQCGVTFVSSKVIPKDIKVGECRTFKSFEIESRRFKPEIFIPAVSALARNATTRAILNGVLIGSLCQILKSNPTIMNHPHRDEAIGRINFLAIYNKAIARFKLEQSGTQKSVLTSSLYQHLCEKLNIETATV